ncbi:MAG: TAXI family TRAP transporter solute-binding subunit [Rhodocyclaceae bacterium]|nr:TAXI family TRAP transporter solute-binding subunit [Rhodocyclaceae bacterium]
MKRLATTPRILLLLACCLQAGFAAGADRVRIFVAGPEQSVQALMARDIARHVARAADIEMDIRTVAGTPAALLRLPETGALQMAMLQADAAQAYAGAALRGNPDASRMIGPVRIVAQLHEEEIHFVVRSDSPMNNLHDLAQARINLGPMHGGAALTVAALYRLLFSSPIPEALASFLSNEDALVKLITEQTIDAVAIVAPRPAKLLADMKPEARRFVKLLKFDASQPGAEAALKIYTATAIPAATYPNLLSGDLPALSVRIYLVASGHGEKNEAILARFAAAWCRNLPRIGAEGHAKWAGIEPAPPPLATGWIHARTAEREIRACIDGTPPPPETCELENRLLGLCR